MLQLWDGDSAADYFQSHAFLTDSCMMQRHVQAVPLRVAAGPSGPHCPPRPLLAFKPPPPLNFHRPVSLAAPPRPPSERPASAKSAPPQPSINTPTSLDEFPLKWGRRRPRSPGGGHQKREKNGSSGMSLPSKVANLQEERILMRANTKVHWNVNVWSDKMNESQICQDGQLLQVGRLNFDYPVWAYGSKGHFRQVRVTWMRLTLSSNA